MKVFNSKLAAIGLAAFVFASCSDNTSDPTGGSSPAKVDYDGKESYNSANYVTLYKDYICVAYGRSRVQIFKLVNTK